MRAEGGFQTVDTLREARDLLNQIRSGVLPGVLFRVLWRRFHRTLLYQAEKGNIGKL